MANDPNKGIYKMTINAPSGGSCHNRPHVASYFFFLIFLAAALLLPASPLHAGGRLSASVAKEYANSKTARLTRIIAAELGCELHMVYAPLGRRLALMEEGELDFAVGLYKLAEREAYIEFVEPAYKKDYHLHFFQLKNSPVKIETYEDLHGLKIGTKIGSAYFDRFDHDPDIIKIPVATLEQNFEMLLLERVDAVILSYALGLHHIHKMDIDRQIRSSGYCYQEHIPLYVGISKKSQLMNRRKDMEAVLIKLMKNGQM